MALRNFLKFRLPLLQHRQLNQSISFIPVRASSFNASEEFKDYDNHPDVVVTKNPPEWKYVERLLGYQVIPKPTVKSEYPSGWTAPNPELYKDLPYFIERTKNYMLPVYLHITFRGQRRTTLIKNIEGDIWQLEQELNKVISKRVQKRIFSRINEMSRQIVFKGDYVTLIQKYLADRGL
ncbi:CLUMA_CG011035, isoform A [Clunio marinus]|uniref:Large ribosomal subunit protein mL49 n=1 Tax=Clunio marinus TaxID=568069 RepID=A0A1J1ID38_9DIPT|nr:CLUMA_CG011035, isoform A [Clunio marinus]